MDQILSPGWATYLRVSDEDKQTPERSFAMQRQRIQEQLLAPSDIPFKREYYDMLTGTSPNRADYQQMLADAEAGRFSHLGLYRADRFGRNTVEGLNAATRLIGMGIKIRVAHMPSLRPEEPDGFFMFLIQMGLAQREVDVLRQRTADGMEAKLRVGGWPQKAPDGYLNKERLISSNKYERWVEKDADFNHVIRKAWDMLLTDSFTLEQICEELAAKGYTRASGRPWAWNDLATGVRRVAKNCLHNIFHNPFYAGWVVSGRFGIKIGEIRGKWEPTVSTVEFERGIQILLKHGDQKSRFRRKFYLLRGILWLKMDGRLYKLFGSTPSGRSQSYSYYVSNREQNGKQLHLPCDVVDEQIPSWLGKITIIPELIPSIRQLYQEQVKQVTGDNRDSKIAELKRQLAQLRDEEARLARLVIMNKITEETYDRLRAEWKEKLRKSEISLAEMESESKAHFDDLDVALILMSKLPELFPRLKEADRTKLLQILARRIIVDPSGEIIDYELNSPFMYLDYLAGDLRGIFDSPRGSSDVSVGVQN